MVTERCAGKGDRLRLLFWHVGEALQNCASHAWGFNHKLATVSQTVDFAILD